MAWTLPASKRTDTPSGPLVPRQTVRILRACSFPAAGPFGPALRAGLCWSSPVCGVGLGPARAQRSHPLPTLPLPNGNRLVDAALPLG